MGHGEISSCGTDGDRPGSYSETRRDIQLRDRRGQTEVIQWDTERYPAAGQTGTDRGCGNYFEVGGGGQTSPGVQGSPYPKLKTARIWPTIFWERPKFTCKNKQKYKRTTLTVQRWGGGAGSGAPQLPSCGGNLPPLLPPPPPVPASLWTDRGHTVRQSESQRTDSDTSWTLVGAGGGGGGENISV